MVESFYENVKRHTMEHRALAAGEKEENVVLQFKPEPRQTMYIACLWSHWTDPKQPDLRGFAAITDEPPPDVAAAGHDRCIINLKLEHVDQRLTPEAHRASSCRQYCRIARYPCFNTRFRGRPDAGRCGEPLGRHHRARARSPYSEHQTNQSAGRLLNI